MIDSNPRVPGSKGVLADTLEQDASLGSVQTVGEALLESPSVSCRDVAVHYLSLIHISEPTRRPPIS